MTCAACKKRGKPDYFGSDPKCAFENGFFSGDNWNCATANLIRDVCDMESELIDYQYCDDDKYVTINIWNYSEISDTNIGYALWVKWYKSRGRTENMLLLGDDAEVCPRPPTEAECLAIHAHFSPT